MKVKSVSLGEIATVVAGQSPPGSTYNETGLGMPFFQGKADFGDIHPIARKWCTSPKRIAEEGDILISIRAPVGPTNIALEQCCIGRGLAIIRPNEAIALRSFGHWSVVHRRAELITKGRGSTFAAIGKNDLKSLKILLPSLDEQRRIAGILDRAARIERLRAQAADRLHAFAPALFVKMFGDPAGNPMGWKVARIGDVCTVIGGGTPRRGNEAYFGGPILWATPTDVTALTDLFIARTKESITEMGLRESSARLIPAGAVLLTSRATIGYTAIAARPMATNQGFANLICGDRLTPEYLACWLRARRDLLERMAGGTTFKEISKLTLKGIEIPLPPLVIQGKHARILEILRGISTCATVASENASLLTDSLMDRLLREGKRKETVLAAQRKRGITCSP